MVIWDKREGGEKAKWAPLRAEREASLRRNLAERWRDMMRP